MRNVILIVWILLFLFSLNSVCQEPENSRTDTISFSYYLSIANKQLNKQAPDWVLNDLNGKLYKLSDFYGKLTLIEFWGTGCGACVRTANDVSIIDSVYKSKGLVVIGIESSTSSIEKIKIFKQKYNFNYLTLVGGKEISQQYGVRGFPTFFLIDKTGKVIYTHLGYFPSNTKQKMIDSIEEHL